MIEVIAFKDWAAVCDAMGQGRQSVILRKGGLAEGRDGFHFRYPEFFLFPTGYHEQFSKLRHGLTDGLQSADSVRAGQVRIRDFFRLEWHTAVTDWPAARALEAFHPYREEVVRERFDYDANPGLQVAFGRAFRLDRPWTFSDEASFGGCRSWIKLPSPAPDFASMTPALDEVQHATLATKLDAWLNEFGISAFRLAPKIHG
jgi:hypothetical protein